MKTARSRWFLRLARPYARRLIGRSLDGLHVAGLDEARSLVTAAPILFAANHVAWWDPMLLLPLDAALGSEGHALMDAANLARLPFFGWVGAIPLDRRSPAASRRGLKGAVSLLSAPGRAVWIFPQGRQRPSWVRPLDLKPGARLLARLSGASVVPVSLTYAFREAPQPAAVVCFGAPLQPRRQDLMAALEASLLDGLARNDAFLEGASEGYTTLIRSRAQRSEDGIGAQILARIGQGEP